MNEKDEKYEKYEKHNSDLTNKDAGTQSTIDYVILLKQIIYDIQKQELTNLSSADQMLLQFGERLPLDFTGACDAYALVNHFVLNEPYYIKFPQERSEKEPSSFSEEYINQLVQLHKKMSTDPDLNWFGVPNPVKLDEANLYGGTNHYNQSMQSMVAHLAQNFLLARQGLQQSLSETGIGLDTEFLEDYLNGRLSDAEIEYLDGLCDQLKYYGSDYETVQAALHTYRYIVASQFSPLEKAGINLCFLNSRVMEMPISNTFKELDIDQLKQRIEYLIPQGPVRAYYEHVNPVLASNLELVLAIGRGDETVTDEMNYAYALRKKREGQGVYTFLTSNHYRNHMEKVLARSQKVEIVCAPKNANLPLYSSQNQGGTLVPVNFLTCKYVKNPKLNTEAFIENVEFGNMADLGAHNEGWEGESINKHQRRLFAIALLTPHFEVAEAAQRHHEFWYSNLTPWQRGSSAISEAFSKSILLSHGKILGQMSDFLPDLWAIFNDEVVFVDTFPDLYQGYSEREASLLPANYKLAMQLEYLDYKINNMVVFNEEKKEQLAQLKDSVACAFEKLAEGTFSLSDLKELKQAHRQINTPPLFFKSDSKNVQEPPPEPEEDYSKGN